MQFNPTKLASMKLLPAIAVLAATGCIATTIVAQERRAFDEGFDPRKTVIFEDNASNSFREATSPDGKLRVELSHKKIRIYQVEKDNLLHEFTTSGGNASPLFTDDSKTLIAAVYRGNLGAHSTLYSWDLETGERTRWGECIGMVLDVDTDAEDKRLAVTTYYGDIHSFAIYGDKKRWLGGEMVVFDAAKPNSSVRIVCELSGVPSIEQLAKQAQEMGKDSKEFSDYSSNFLNDANRRCLPLRVGLTPDGKKVIGVTSTGVVKVFDAGTGKAELTLSGQGRAGAEMFLPPKADS